MENTNIPYIAFESATSRLERSNKRLWVVIIILIITLVATNAGWLYRESQFEDVVVTQEAIADGDSDIQLQNISGDYNGRESETDSQN